VPQLIKEAVRIAIKQSGAKDNTYNWVTSVYPIIHLPNDTSELGYLHTDKIQYAGDMITIWVPLNSGQHSPLSILPKSHFLSNFVISKGSSLIFSQTFIFNLLEKIGLIIKLKHDTGDLLFWNGNTQHTGNLNTTNAPTVALVIRTPYCRKQLYLLMNFIHRNTARLMAQNTIHLILTWISIRNYKRLTTIFQWRPFR